jgi:hypothetical protein
MSGNYRSHRVDEVSSQIDQVEMDEKNDHTEQVEESRAKEASNLFLNAASATGAF